jgi:two-component sensor histidine kinase
MKSIKFYFLIIVLISFLVVSVFLVAVIYYRYNAGKDNLVNIYTEQLELRHSEIEFQLNNVVSDLKILSDFEVFKDLVNSENKQSLKSIEQLFKLFSTERGIYDQIRFLDTVGTELVRINYNQGDPLVVHEQNLQSKGNRYYFKDTIELEEGGVFFSPLDLNIENGNIEIPEKPVIRIGIPVFNDRMVKQGIILVNYFGDNVIDIISRPYRDSDSVYFLLNKSSFWLYSSIADNNWAFMYEGRKNINFKNKNPEVWNHILNKTSGTVVQNKGTYIFTTISPYHEHEYRSDISSSDSGSSEVLFSDDNIWILAVHLSPQVFLNLRKMLISDMFLQIIISYLFAVILSIFIAKMVYIKRSADQQTRKSLAEKELLLREIHHRVKNSLALVSSFIGLYRIENPEHRNEDFFDALQQKIDTISLVHTYLYQSSDIKRISIKYYLKDLLESLIGNLVVSSENITLNLEIADIFLPAKPAITIGLILSELAINSLKHAFPDNKRGVISVDISQNESNWTIVYYDDGIGLPKDFILNKSNSLGMVLIQSLTQQLGGKLNIKTGDNSSFIFIIPFIS